ncbi:ribosomal protein S12 methylthiotransferase [Peptoniphilus asaccharolyticus DSM 20463]|uniref:Ribosomal protein uS12 methylthiotransferase RimO n=1 Tax=Peptoniphilus asaccharolyticus DSM 20463 TaxID=573058 RepID=A0A1W1US59_PEPAS|nr:30S ribosomal protein S12 methylthiotransferase RimO [Peptoniphilus asaccharolyticus]MBL7575096.1 30S ribosomal protein S12 methylthiotransferase RimO [Peptoniphilus asaccharolyticus]SMB83671.1 ribosomal protein S12 methylthiotransferase [Peptoniphilus asaccharolyticus DSM 20463]
MNKVHFITLGCSKNDIDTTTMKSNLNNNSYEITSNPNDANVIVVNTCGFIEAAKEESINTILEAAKLKENGNLKKLVLAGCLAQRYSNELMDEIPEVDGIIGTGSFKDINDVIDSAFDGDRKILLEDFNEYTQEINYKDDVQVSEYVRIAEGCNNNCSYCIIPKLRGRNNSRPIEEIVKEVEYLTANGTREIILIAQNSTDYGIDLYKDYKLKELVAELSKIELLKWIRILYLYPDNFTDELIEEFKTNPKLLKYVDIPLQHISDNVLKKMYRKTSKAQIETLIKQLRNNIPDIAIRTTFIVGFPGETEEDFEELVEFLDEYKLDRVGAFAYSREEDTPAYFMDNQIDEEVKNERLERIMGIQQDISAEIMLGKIGSELEVLIEEEIEDGIYSGRSYLDAPEIDGNIYVSSDKELEIGAFYKVRISNSLEFDLEGEVI